MSDVASAARVRTAQTFAAVLDAFFARTRRRLTWIAAAQGATAGIFVALVIVLLFAIGRRDPATATAITMLVFAMGMAGAAIRAIVSRESRESLPRRIEQNAPECRNLLVTAAEILADRVRVRPFIRDVVCDEAARLAARLDPAALFPARRSVIALGGAFVLWLVAIAAVSGQPRSTAGSILAGNAGPPEITAIDVSIAPPPYSGLTAESQRDPVRVEVLEGSRVTLALRAAASTIAVETPEGQRVLDAAGPGEFVTGIIAEDDGFAAFEPRAADGSVGERRLIGITVRADQPARVRVTEPGHDLFLPDAARTLDVEIDATDDLGLVSLSLRYTRVRGSGEQFTFADGEMPLVLERRDGRSWIGRTTLRLDTLGLEPGDVFVYRGLASDAKPGRAPIESDAFLVEITAPGAIASEGFAMDDEQDRYALSQQMVILKTERLIARASSLAEDSLVREARSLAAEQRSVRAEFVFMMGGELAEEVEQANIGDLNEEDHIEADDEAIAGRLENQGRFALIRAIRSMSRAYAALNETELATALAEEKLALDHLQNAFARTRYILRALTEREQIDLARRLTGALADASRDVRPLVTVPEREQVAVLRDALRSVGLLATGELSAADASRITITAQQLLQIDPSAPVMQEISTVLLEAAASLRDDRVDDTRRLLGQAASGLSDRLRAELPVIPGGTRRLDVDRLDGALTDALRRGGG
jgi:hypothetical protein